MKIRLDFEQNKLELSEKSPQKNDDKPTRGRPRKKTPNREKPVSTVKMATVYQE